MTDDIAAFIEKSVAPIDFHLMRGTVEGQKYNRPLSPHPNCFVER
jgi:hypothetical protein